MNINLFEKYAPFVRHFTDELCSSVSGVEFEDLLSVGSNYLVIYIEMFGDDEEKIRNALFKIMHNYVARSFI
jgi:DNA-directed RNA polymerase specialized sigma subunit